MSRARNKAPSPALKAAAVDCTIDDMRRDLSKAVDVLEQIERRLSLVRLGLVGMEVEGPFNGPAEPILGEVEALHDLAWRIGCDLEKYAGWSDTKAAAE